MKPFLLLFSIFAWMAAASQSITDTGYSYRAPSPGGLGKFYFGREIANIMDASGSDWLERESRPREENTDKIVQAMQLKPQMTVADVGAGTGYYTFRMAKLVPDGKVYAVEIQDELIEKLNEKKKEIGAKQVEVVRGDTLSVNLPENTVDLAIMVDVYHELSWPREIIQSIKKKSKAWWKNPACGISRRRSCCSHKAAA